MLFADNEKLVFCYEIGGEKRYADPLEIRRRLIRATSGEINDILKDAGRRVDPDSGNPIENVATLAAQEKRTEAGREAFDLPPLNPKTGDGVPESEVVRILGEFLRWLEKNAS